MSNLKASEDSVKRRGTEKSQGKPISIGWPKEAAKEAEGKPGATVFRCWPPAFIFPFSCQEHTDLPLGNSLLSPVLNPVVWNLGERCWLALPDPPDPPPTASHLLSVLQLH